MSSQPASRMCPPARPLLRRIAAAALRPDPQLTVSSWADRYRRLSSKSASEYGQWSTDRVPYMREIMDAMSPTHPCTDGDFMKGAQISGTESLLNVVGFYIDQEPCPVMVVWPTTDMAKKLSRTKLQPMIDETPALRDKVAEARSRDQANTTLMKDYPGGYLVITGANSGPGLRSFSIRVLMLDEIDAYPDDVDGEGDPVELAKKRTDTFVRAKRFNTSTPKIKGRSRIERRYNRGTRAQFYVPCPHCAHEQVLEWGQIRWETVTQREVACRQCGGVTEVLDTQVQACAHCGAGGEALRQTESDTLEVARAWYECLRCAQPIEEGHKSWMLAHGRHQHRSPGAGEFLADDDPHPHAIWVRVGDQVRRFLPRFTKPLSWHVSALYSPWFTWAKAVAQYLEAKLGGVNEETGESYEQVFANTVLGEAYEVVGEQPKREVLKLRAEPYQLGTVEDGGLLLTAAVDVQGDRLEVKVKAWGRGEESWLVDYQVLHGDSSRTGPESVWEQLTELRRKSYLRRGGSTLSIAAMAIDSGYLPQVVYDYTRKWRHKHVFATKGQSQQGKTILGLPTKVDVHHRGRKVKHGAEVWPIGADTAKELIYKRLEIDPLASAGPGAMHFPIGLPDAYYDGLTAEKLIRRLVRGREQHIWDKVRERNEPLDLEVLCYAAAIYAGIKRVDWDNLERVVVQADLFAVKSEPKPERTPELADKPPPEPPAAPQRTPEPAASGLFVARPPGGTRAVGYRP